MFISQESKLRNIIFSACSTKLWVPDEIAQTLKTSKLPRSSILSFRDAGNPTEQLRIENAGKGRRAPE